MAENDADDGPEEPEEEFEASGFEELLYAIADALRAKRSKEAIATLIERYAGELSVTARRRHRELLLSYGFTLVVLVAIGGLGWLKVISSETAGALLGAVVGSVFYGRRGN
jgi:hypothetical protein